MFALDKYFIIIMITIIIQLCFHMAGQVPASLIIETIVEHVAKMVNKHPIMVKELNLYEKHQVGGFRPMGMELVASLIGYLLGFRMDWMLALFPVLSCCKWF